MHIFMEEKNLYIQTVWKIVKKYCEEQNYEFMDNDGNLWQLQIDDSELYEE